jgi:hypothetical protein
LKTAFIGNPLSNCPDTVECLQAHIVFLKGMTKQKLDNNAKVKYANKKTPIIITGVFFFKTVTAQLFNSFKLSTYFFFFALNVPFG